MAYGISVHDIIRANPGVDLRFLRVGQQICIPLSETIKPARESLTYLFGGNAEYYLTLLSQTQNSIKTVCPDFFELSDDGNLILAGENKLNPGFIQALHQQNIKVVPFLSNHWDRAKGEIALDNRELLSSQITEAVMQYNLDGVDVDIENVTHLHRNEYVDFTRLLRQKLPRHKIVSVAVAANPHGWITGWHGSYDYKALSYYADYLMIMNYDESYFGSQEGPVSGKDFFNQSIQYAFREEVPKEKIVVGIPFFGRFWKVGEAVGGYGLAARDVAYLLENYQSTAYFDEASQSAFAEVTIAPGDPEPTVLGGRILTAGTYRIWYDNETATRYKLNVINGYDVKGAGSWALGQEILAIWDFYTRALNDEVIVPAREPLPGPHPAPVPEPIPIPAPGQVMLFL
jgi:spore germination protein YaaH